MTTDTLPTGAAISRTASAPAETHLGWLRVALFCALVAGPAAIIAHLIGVYAIDVPFWDQWETARFFSVTRYGHDSIFELARQQNESRLFFPNLVFLGLSLPGTWSVVREMYLSVALVAGISGTLFQLLRRTGFPLLAQAALLFIINWPLFSLTQHENWFFGIQICYYMVPAALCLALLANSSERSLGWKTGVSLGLAFVAAYSFSGGVIVCLLAFPGWLPANWSAAGGWRPSRQELGWHALYAGVSVVYLAVYFWGYQEPAGAGSLLFLFKHLWVSLDYFFIWLGSPLAPRGSLGLAAGIGLTTCLLLGALVGAAFWRCWADRGEQRRLYPWIILAAYAVGTGLMAVIGRSGFGTQQALSSRYITFSNFAYIAILVLAAYLWKFHGRRATARTRMALLAASFALLAVTAGTFARAQTGTMPWIVDGSNHRNFAAQGLTFLPVLPSSQNLDTLCGVPEYIQKLAPDLMRRHLLNVPVVSASLLERIQKTIPEGYPEFGELDEPTVDQSGKVSIRGWAVDPAKRQPAGSVLITCTGADHVTHPLVVLVTDVYRPEKARAPGAYQRMPCAFMGLVSFDRLAPGPYLVAAWAVDTATSRANQIASAYPFKWERSGRLSRPFETIVFPPMIAQQDSRNGSLEGATPAADGALTTHGWALDINSGTVPKAALITCTDAAGKTWLVGHVGPREPRQDVVDLLHNDSLMYCGFQARADLRGLPPGDYLVAAWGVRDDEDESLAQLGGTFPVHVPLK